MEIGFAYWVMHASPIVIVGVPALLYAGALLILCLGERVPMYLYNRHTFFWLLILAAVAMVSVGAWQYVAMALNFWPLVLAATPVEAIGGYYHRKAVTEDRRQDAGKSMLYHFAYWTAMLALTVGGALIWGKGMQLITGSTPASGFLVVWAVLFVLALIVGEVAWHYMEEGFKPIYALLRKPGNVRQTAAAIELAIQKKTADLSVSESLRRSDNPALRTRFGNLADLLLAEEKAVSADALLALDKEHYNRFDLMQAQKEQQERDAAQAEYARAKAAQSQRERVDTALQQAVSSALEVIVGRSVLTISQDTRELYARRLKELAKDLSLRGEKVTSYLLIKHYDHLYGGNGVESDVDLEKVVRQ